MTEKQYKIADELLKYLLVKEGRANMDQYPEYLEENFGFDWHKDVYYVREYLLDNNLVNFLGSQTYTLGITREGEKAAKIGTEQYFEKSDEENISLNTETLKGQPTIFISHSSKDKEIIEQFVERILVLGCGIEDTQIFCTSIEGLGLKTGVEFREHIRNNLRSASHTFLFISNNYKKSEVCLNEMGATWVLENKNVKPFIFPNQGFDSLGFIYNVKQGAQLGSESDLDELHEELKMDFKSEVKLVRWNKHKNEFLSFLRNQKLSEDNFQSKPDDYFKLFIEKDINMHQILFVAQPTLSDCKVVFSKRWYNHFYNFYCKVFEQFEKETIEPLFPKKRYYRFEKINSNELSNGLSKISGGMFTLGAQGAFNNDVIFYKVTFLENENSDSGISYKVFCYINNRWVFFAKPWNLKIPPPDKLGEKVNFKPSTS